MLVIVITALIIVLISFAKDVTYTTNAKDSQRSHNDNDMLKELLQRIDRMERNNNVRFDQMERNNNIRFDKLEANVRNIEANVRNIAANDLNIQDNIKNLSIVMETIVEQQMVITAEIFTVSQTLPFCCCQYQNTTEPTEIETTTPKPEKTLPKNCAEAMGESNLDGVYQINVTDSNIGPFDVYCMKKVKTTVEKDPINGIWLIFQRRQDGTTDFYRNWNMYQRGFGDLKGNFWIGLDKLYAITKSTEQQLWIQLEDHEGNTRWAKYSHFAIGNEYEKYALKTLEGFFGSAHDSLTIHKGQKWSTFDQENGVYHCAQACKGAWWYKGCHQSNLNGMYGNDNEGQGINWAQWRGLKYSFKYVHMAIRPWQ